MVLSDYTNNPAPERVQSSRQQTAPTPLNFEFGDVFMVTLQVVGSLVLIGLLIGVITFVVMAVIATNA